MLISSNKINADPAFSDDLPPPLITYIGLLGTSAGGGTFTESMNMAADASYVSLTESLPIGSSTGPGAYRHEFTIYANSQPLRLGWIQVTVHATGPDTYANMDEALVSGRVFPLVAYSSSGYVYETSFKIWRAI